MMSEPEGLQGAERSSEARTRILDAAEALLMKRGFSAVTLRDIAEPLGLNHSSLYYHFPGGKEQLFSEVMERNIRRHGEGLAAAIAAGEGSLRSELRGIAAWLLSQPPMDLIRMAESDLEALPAASASRIMALVYELVIGRVQAAFEEALRSGQVGPCDPGLLAGGVIGLLESLHSAPEREVGRTRSVMANDLLDIILKGIEYKGRVGG
jgi:TetR/AcrR family transcriptional regulator, cholesterol catabolism regulator